MVAGETTTEQREPRLFFNLKAHEGKHPLEVHRWNPYWLRAHTPLLSDACFKAMNRELAPGTYIDPAWCFIGCLDAPDEIPLGATTRVATVGGWEREEYLNAPRESVDWRSRARGDAAVGRMLKQLLKEAEAAEETQGSDARATNASAGRRRDVLGKESMSAG